MSARGGDTTTMPGRKPGRRAAASISPPPPPQEVFVDWLLSVPHDADLEEAARWQIALIDARMHLHPDVRCLRMLLVAVAGESAYTQPSKSF